MFHIANNPVYFERIFTLYNKTEYHTVLEMIHVKILEKFLVRANFRLSDITINAFKRRDS